MTDDETDTEALRTAREAFEQAGDDSMAERLDGRIENKRDAMQSIVEMRQLAEQAEEAGLAGDPAIEGLREEADALAEEYGLADDEEDELGTDEKLSDEYGLTDAALQQMHEDDRERLAEALDSLNEIQEKAGRLEGLARHEAESRRNDIERLLDHNGVEAASLIGDDSGEEKREFHAALAEDHSAEVDDDGKSERVLAAELRDERDQLDAELADTDHPLLQLELTEEIERIDDRLAGLDVEQPA